MTKLVTVVLLVISEIVVGRAIALDGGGVVSRAVVTGVVSVSVGKPVILPVKFRNSQSGQPFVTVVGIAVHVGKSPHGCNRGVVAGAGGNEVEFP